MHLYRLTTTAKKADLPAVPARSAVRRVAESAAAESDSQQSLRQQLAESSTLRDTVEPALPSTFAELVAQLRELGELAERLIKRLDGEASGRPYRPINEEV